MRVVLYVSLQCCPMLVSILECILHSPIGLRVFPLCSAVCGSLQDVPGRNLAEFNEAKGPLFADGHVDWVGQAIGLIAATTRGVAEAAAGLVKVSYP